MENAMYSETQFRSIVHVADVAETIATVMKSEEKVWSEKLSMSAPMIKIIKSTI
jgi:hypothetical protein